MGWIGLGMNGGCRNLFCFHDEPTYSILDRRIIYLIIDFYFSRRLKSRCAEFLHPNKTIPGSLSRPVQMEVRNTCGDKFKGSPIFSCSNFQTKG